MSALRVYLDSSDFSVLSDPGRSIELASILRQLQQWIVGGQITCLFSGTHLSEMAPIDAGFTSAAERRADLLVELCDRNALISQDRLFKEELRFALHLTEDRPVVDSSIGEWYPAGVEDMFPSGRVNLQTTNFEDIINSWALSRKYRREAMRKASKNGKLKPGMQAKAVESARKDNLDEILLKYPMRPENARVLTRYAVGDATGEDANTAFLESLRDPRWMMQWFSKHHEQLSPFIEWTRGPSGILLTSIDEMAACAASARELDCHLGTSLADSVLSRSKWVQLQDDLLLGVAQRLSEEFFGQKSFTLTPAAIDNDCPGLSTGIRSLHSAWWTVTSHMPRRAKLSDVPDALHAMYAPYVDVFRADAFMAPHIDKIAREFGTKVVPKLTALIPAIQAAFHTKKTHT